MPLKLDDKLVIGVSSRALFDLEAENRIFEDDGLDAYSDYQIYHEKDILKPGTAFPLIKALQQLNAEGRYLTEIIVMSKNSADTSLRIFNSIEHYNLDISRAALVGGASIAPYLSSFKTDLFLSADEKDVQEAINANVAAVLVVPMSNLDLDMTGYVLDTLGAESKNVLTPAYYELNLQGQISKDVESTISLDIIISTLRYDIGYLAVRPAGAMMRALNTAYSTDLASAYKRQMSSINNTLETLVESIVDNYS